MYRESGNKRARPRPPCVYFLYTIGKLGILFVLVELRSLNSGATLPTGFRHVRTKSTDGMGFTPLRDLRYTRVQLLMGDGAHGLSAITPQHSGQRDADRHTT